MKIIESYDLNFHFNYTLKKLTEFETFFNVNLEV